MLPSAPVTPPATLLALQALWSGEALADPCPGYERLRALGRAGVLAVPEWNAAFVTGHAATNAVLRSPAARSGAWLEGPGVPVTDATALLRPMMLFHNGASHVRLRSLVQAAFTPRVVEEQRALVRATLTELLDELARRGEGDVVGDLATPLPVRVIMTMLGLSGEDEARFLRWSLSVAELIGGAAQSPELMARIGEDAREMRAFFRDLADELRRRPQPGLLSALAAVEDGGLHAGSQRLSGDELLSNAVLLLAAGHETTANLIAGGLLALARQPGAWAALLERPDHPGVADELLRFVSPVQLDGRTLSADLTVGTGRCGRAPRSSLCWRRPTATRRCLPRPGSSTGTGPARRGTSLLRPGRTTAWAPVSPGWRSRRRSPRWPPAFPGWRCWTAGRPTRQTSCCAARRRCGCGWREAPQDEPYAYFRKRGRGPDPARPDRGRPPGRLAAHLAAQYRAARYRAARHRAQPGGPGRLFPPRPRLSVGGFPMTPSTHHQIAIIGSGFAGLGMAARLRRRGVTDFAVFERAGEVGGTWRDNTYPGCACDVKSDLYSFSFAPNPEWRHRYARQPEILEYLRRTADRFEVRPHIRFGHEVERAEWDDVGGLWHLQTSGGSSSARVLISGHGPLIEPKWPEIPGLETFSGARFHSARWDHSAQLHGKRVAVIGTGASAVQFVPEVQKVAAGLTVFQRSAPWVMPRLDRPTGERRRALFRRLPALQRLSRQWIFGVAEARFLSFSDPRVGRLAEQAGRRHLEAQVADPALRAKLTPDYRLGCKRILISDDYYPALTRPGVELVTERICEVRGAHLVTADGQEREFDVLIGGTGFNATRPAVARLVFGREGRSLAETWQPHMEALHGTTVVGFPNLFMIVGPNTGLGHNSMVYMMEAQMGYILRALEHLDTGHLLSLEPRPEAQAAYNAALQRKLRGTVWMQGGCTSWYIDEGGRNTSLWPQRAAQFRRALSHFDPALYRARLSPRPLPTLLSPARSG